MNNTNLHKINEILNIIKMTKEKEKKILLKTSKDEVVKVPINSKFPRRLYLKKKIKNEDPEDEILDSQEKETKKINDKMISKQEDKNKKGISKSLKKLKVIKVFFIRVLMKQTLKHKASLWFKFKSKLKFSFD